MGSFRAGSAHIWRIRCMWRIVVTVTLHQKLMLLCYPSQIWDRCSLRDNSAGLSGATRHLDQPKNARRIIFKGSSQRDYRGCGGQTVNAKWVRRAHQSHCFETTSNILPMTLSCCLVTFVICAKESWKATRLLNNAQHRFRSHSPANILTCISLVDGGTCPYLFPRPRHCVNILTLTALSVELRGGKVIKYEFCTLKTFTDSVWPL